MSALIPLLVAVPAVTGIAGYVARDLRGVTPGQPLTGAVSRPPELLPPTAPPARPLIEFFNLAELTTTDPKGFVRPVERYHVEPWGLYLARTVDTPRFQYIESWLLPEVSLRATITHCRPGHHRNQDYCLGFGEFTKIAPKRWKAVDHYLDIAVRRGRSCELRGIDRLLGAHAAGLVDTAQAHRAVQRASAALDGLAAHDHDVEAWLASRGITLTWM